MTNKLEQKPKRPKGMSLFFKRIAQAVFKFGGWMTPKSVCSPWEKQFVVFEGEYAGTWLFNRMLGKLTYRYEGAFLLRDPASGIGKKKGYGLKVWKEQLVEEHLRYSHAITKLDWSAKPKRTVEELDEELSCTNRDCKNPYCKGAVFKRTEVLETEFGETAIVFAARAGYDPVFLLRELNKNPGRVESLKQALRLDQRLASHKDRVSFSKRFFLTWSVRKSLPAWVKRPQRWKVIIDAVLNSGFYLHRLDTLKLVPEKWTGIDSLDASGIVRITEQFLMSLESANESFRSAFGCDFKSLGILEKRKFIKDMLDPREDLSVLDEQVRYMHKFWDALGMWENILPEYYALVDEHREWIPRLLKAIEKRQGYVFIQMHDRISEASMTVNTFADKDKIKFAESYHKSCPVILGNTKDCLCSAEFKQLTTVEEFNKEGTELKHCIAHYFLEPSGAYYMSMKSKVTGERTSVAIGFYTRGGSNDQRIGNLYWEIAQHYGFANDIPSECEKEMLDHHLKHCCKPVYKVELDTSELDISQPF